METEKLPIKLDFEKLNGLSETQIKEHYEVLYKGYVKKINEIRTKLESVSKDTSNATFSDFRSLKTEETFAKNGVILHERYFKKLGGIGGIPNGKLLELINSSFGSFNAWLKDFKACGMAARGWVVLAYDFNDKQLRNYICDIHNQGGVWGCSPILVMDVYEHAYFIDYATKKAAYIDAFFKNIDWDKINNSLESLDILNK